MKNGMRKNERTGTPNIMSGVCSVRRPDLSSIPALSHGGCGKKIAKKGFCRAWHGGALSHPRGIDIKRFRKHNFCDQGLLVTACSGTLVSVNKRQWKGNNSGRVVPQRGWIVTFQAR